MISLLIFLFYLGVCLLYVLYTWATSFLFFKKKPSITHQKYIQTTFMDDWNWDLFLICYPLPVWIAESLIALFLGWVKNYSDLI